MTKLKRLTKIVHPNSRKALELAAKEHHKIRNQRSNENTKNRTNVLLKKLLWFKETLSLDSVDAEPNMDTTDNQDEIEEDENKKKLNGLKSKTFFTNQDMHALLDYYFHRFDDELDQIKTKNSIGKRAVGQHFSREKAIQLTLETERNEYNTCGIVLPDMSTAELTNKFRAWNGDANTIPSLKLKPFKKCFF